MTPDECKRKGIKCGIWQGRFQCIHNGHYHVYNTTLTQFPEQMIAIVNPNPITPADSTFVRFGYETNPLNYFQRMLLWKAIIDENNRKVSLFPCWHARKCVNLEREFLPEHTHTKAGRCWIMPLMQDDNEIQKARDLEAQGEMICEANWDEEDWMSKGISATYVRELFRTDKIEEVAKLVPSSVLDITQRLFVGEDPYKYLIVPCIGDSIDYSSLQYAMDWARKSNDRRVVIAIAVCVSNASEWWFKRAQPISNLIYYQKMKELEAGFYDLDFHQFLITPIFVQNNSFRSLWEYSAAFLPASKKSHWVVNNDCVYDLDFLGVISNTEVIIKEENLLADNYYQVFINGRMSPLKSIETADGNAQDLLREIARFIRVNRMSSDEKKIAIVQRFSEIPAQLKELIRQLNYNHISIVDFDIKVSKITEEWRNK